MAKLRYIPWSLLSVDQGWVPAARRISLLILDSVSCCYLPWLVWCFLVALSVEVPLLHSEFPVVLLVYPLSVPLVVATVSLLVLV